MRADLSELIARNAAFTPRKTALRFEDQTLSYEAFAARIDATAAALSSELGVGRGDRVAVLALNHPDTLVLLYACARLGAILLPLNWRLATPELSYILQDADAKAVFVADDYQSAVPALQQSLPQAAFLGFGDASPTLVSLSNLIDAATGDGRGARAGFSDPVLLMYTSGTTGRPKGALLRQEALFWNAVQSQHMHNMTAEDHILTALPMFHVGSLNIHTTPALQLGATVTVHPRFAADQTLAAIAQDRPSLAVLVPAAIRALLAHPDWTTTDMSSLRAVTTGSEQVHALVTKAFADKGVPVLQVFGSTETSPIAVYTRLGGELDRGTSAGLPGVACEVRVTDAEGQELPRGAAGEIEVRGPNVFAGYWNNETETRNVLTEDGWYRTGDIGTRDADGYFVIHDRRKNMIISGGENIYPAEIERVLSEHPAVLQCAIIGHPDPKWQEVPVAYVVRRPGIDVDADTLIAHAFANLARYKVPRRVEFMDSLPATALGKVQHAELRADFGRKSRRTPEQATS
jgi:fatty-acyl-CoA synthase